jgi:hypothetical protein
VGLFAPLELVRYFKTLMFNLDVLSLEHFAAHFPQ